MKKILIPFLCVLCIGVVLYYIDPITNKIVDKVNEKQPLVILPSNEFTKKNSYQYVAISEDYTPYSYQDILNIYYSVINNGWDQFTFYCPSEYADCLKDIEAISGDELILTHLNNYIHPFNSFTNVRTSIKESGETTIKIFYLYSEEEKATINHKVNEIMKEVLTNDMEAYDQIKAIHDYIINNANYDVERNEGISTKYQSHIAYGPLFQGYATCNGYKDGV